MSERKPEDVVMGDFRQGLITRGAAVAWMRMLGHRDAQAIVDKWTDELDWEDVEYEHRKAAGE